MASNLLDTGWRDFLQAGRKIKWGSQSCPMPLSFREAEQPAFIVGQDGILRAGCLPAPAGLFREGSGGLTTRRRLPTCPHNGATYSTPAIARHSRPCDSPTPL